MLNILKLLYKYVFSKKTIIVFVIINIIFVVSCLYSSGTFDGYSVLDMYRTEFGYVFYNDFVLVVKILSIIINVFFVSLIFKDSCINLSKYIIDEPVKKLYLIWAKLIFAVLLCVLVVTVLFSYYSLINIILTPFSFIFIEMIHLYLAILALNVTYVLFTFLLMSIIPSMLTSLLPMLLFWYLEMNPISSSQEANTFTIFLHEYIPNISLNNGVYQLSGSMAYYLIIYLISIIIIVAINVKKDVL